MTIAAGDVVLGFPNLIDTTTLSGGNWTSGLPLNNLKNRLISKVARSTNATLASTQFTITKPNSSRVNMIALVGYNFSTNAKFRITTYNGATVIYDSGWLDVNAVVFPYGTLEWEDDNWWSGRMESVDTIGYVQSIVHMLPQSVSSTTWKIEIDDQTNSLGYIDIGRVFIGKSWKPTRGVAVGGATLKWETKTETQESLGGSEYFQRRTPYRVANFTLPVLEEDEAFSNAYEIMRSAGVDQEIFYVHNDKDTTHAQRRRFLGRLRTLNAIEYPYYGKNSVAFEVKELI